MKKIFFGGLLGLAASLALSGCVGTVGGEHTAGVPFTRDMFEGRYARPVEEVFSAAVQVIKEDHGRVSEERFTHNEKSEVRTATGTWPDRTVWVRVQPVDGQVTSVQVQARTKRGGADVNLAHQMEKEIALRLASQ